MSTTSDLNEIKDLVRSTIEQLRLLGRELDAKDSQLINDYRRYDGAVFYINKLAERLNINERVE